MRRACRTVGMKAEPPDWLISALCDCSKERIASKECMPVKRSVLRNSIALLLALALIACAHTNVSDMGAGLYAVTGRGTEQGGTAAARADAVNQATAFCAKSGRKATVEDFDDKPLTAWGSPTSSVVFRCE